MYNRLREEASLERPNEDAEARQCKHGAPEDEQDHWMAPLHQHHKEYRRLRHASRSQRPANDGRLIDAAATTELTEEKNREPRCRHCRDSRTGSYGA